MSTTPRRRRTVLGGTAFALATLMTVAGISAPANAAPGDNTEALAQFLGSNLVSSELLTVGTAESGSPGGPPSDTNPLNLAALQALGLELEVVGDGLEVPLTTDGTTPGLLDLGQAGVIQNYAATTPTGAVAASGLISNDGTIAISENASPTDLGNSSINLTSLLGQLGIADATGPVIDTLSLQIGALASRIESTPGQPVSTQYRVADLKAEVHSALVAALATSLRNAGVSVAGNLDTSLNGLVGSGGVLTGAVNAVPPIRVLGLADVTLGQPTISVDIADLGAVVDTVLGSNAILVSDNRTVTIDLTAGTVTINLAAVVNPGGSNLNGRPANTSVLTPTNIATITAGVSNALGKITAPLTTALDQAVRNSSATVSLQVTATLLPALGNTGRLVDAPITISGTLQQLATGQGVVDTSQLKLLPGVPLCLGATAFGACVGVKLNGLVGALVSSVVTNVVTPLLAALAPAVNGILTSTSTSITAAVDGITTPLLGALNPVLSGVLSNVVDITINEQPQLRTPPETADLGPGSSTVRALSVTLLPRVLGSRLAEIALGSSSVRAQTIDIVETTVRAGNPITVNGAGWVAGTPVSVAFTDGAGDPVGTPVSATPAPAGGYSLPFTVPVGTVGPVTATATQNGVTARDTVAVTAPPSLDILETAVSAGNPITVLGANWAPAVPVSIAFSNAAGAVSTPATPTPLSDGTFSVDFTVPPGTTGPLTAIATQGADVRQDTVAIIPPGVPALNIVETTVVEGDPVTIDGIDWSDSSPVTVTISNGAGTVIDTSTRDPEDGGFSFDFTVPVGTVGPLTAVATQGDDSAEDSAVVVPLPTVDIVETTVVEGTTVTVNGSNWTPGTAVGIRYSTTGDAQLGDPVSITPIDNGSFSTTFLVPVGTQNQVTATATQGTRSDSDQVLVTALPVPPSMDVTEDSVVAGTPVTVTGANWDPTLIVDIGFTNANGVVGTAFTVPEDDGSFSAEFVVPVGTVGPVTATASQGGVSLSDVFDVTPAPAIAVVETTVVEGDTVVVPGTDWIPNVPVSLAFTDGTGAAIPPLVSVTPNGLGSFEQPWQVPLGTVGPVTVVASQSGSNPATDSFAVAARPTIDVTEATVVAGGTVEVTGEDWSPASPVTIVFSNAANEPVGEAVTVTPDPDGTFAVDFVVPVEARGTLTATAGQNGRTATDTIAVTAPPAVDIVETSVVAGDTIRVNGSDFDPTAIVAQVTVTDGTGAVIGDPFFTGIDGDGSFTFPVEVPVGTVGPVTVTATAAGASPADTVVVTDAPSIDITQPTVVAGQPITTVGTDWVPGAVTVDFFDGDGLPIGETVTATADGTGAFTVTVTVPVGTSGPVTATAIQNGRESTDSVVVTPAPPTDPGVDIVEDTVVAGEQITVNGVNWNPGTPLSIRITDGDSLPLLPAVSLTPEADGSFTVLYTVPVGTVGPVRVLVTQGADTATDTVTVTSAPLGSPAIDIEQDTVVAGQPITIVGGNWAESPLTISFIDAAGNPVAGTVTLTPDDGGTFTTTFTVPVGTVGPLRAIAAQGEDSATDTVAVTPAPVADIVETTVVAGQPITVTGANWAPAPLAVVFLDGDLAQVGPTVLLTPSAGGTFETTWTVPVGTAGPITARVSQGDSLASDTVVVTAALASAPAIDIVESTVPAGQPITLNGVNWVSGSDVSIVFYDANGSPVAPAVLATPVDGAFSTVFTVPVGTVGPVRAIATQGADLATDTVAVTAPLPAAPTADITETTVVAGQDITVTGANWADAPLSIVFTDGDAGPLGSVAVTPEGGVFSTSFTIPVGTVGPVRATVTQGADAATDTVAVTPAPGPAPTADITETTVVAGETITLTGADWAATPLSILYSDGNGAPLGQATTLTPDGDGSFSTTFTVPVGTVGPVRATVAQGDDSATDTVLVTPAPAPLPSVDIIENVVRGGQPITVTGADWADTELTIVYTDINSLPIGLPVTLTPVGGEFTTTFVVPVGTPGLVRANVRQGPDFAADSVLVLLSAVILPSADIVQTTVVAGEAIDVTGANWADSELMIVFIDGDGNAVGLPVTTTPAGGVFAIDYTVPVGTVGPLRVVVNQGDAWATDTVVVTAPPPAAPTLDIVEDTVVAGADIEVTGENWGDDSVTIVFTDSMGAAVGFPASATPVDGEFSVDFTVPVGTDGPLRATATHGESSATDTVAVTAAPSTVPTVDIAETTVVAGGTVAVSGANWADAPLSIVYTDGLGVAIGTPVTLTPVDGAFSTTFTVLVGTDGPLRVTVSQGDDTATDTVAVTAAPVAPTVDIAETTVVAGESISVTGAGWADTALTLVYSDGAGTPIGAPVALTPVGGVFSTAFTVPVGTDGPVRVTVAQNGVTATDTVAVTAAPGPAPTADITETTVVAGESIEVTGANWADTPLTIVLTDGNATPIGSAVTLTPEDGVFSTTITVPVGTTGPVRATVSQGDDSATDTVAVTAAPGPAPTADITETTVIAGQPITVTGANWADAPLSIAFADSNAAPIGEPVTLTPVDGAFSTSFTVPVGTSGPVRATVTQGDDSATDTVAVTAAPGPAPAADILETTVVAGQPITVTGANWADTPVSISVADGAGNPIGVPVLVTPVDGFFSQTVTIPVGTTGPVRATVTQGDDSASDTVAVTAAPGPAPTADILETTVVAGETITVTGQNWADAPLSIVIADGNGTAIGIPLSVTPVDGVFSETVTVPVGTTGPVRATVTQGDDSATDTVAVTPAPPAPTANILETTVVAGETITVTGQNWADAPLSIVIADGNGTAIGAPVTVTPVNGVFSQTVTVPDGTTGPVRATVTQGDDVATDTVVVTPAAGPAPSVDIGQTAVVAGEPIDITGENWAGTPLTVTFTDGNGAPLGTPVSLTPEGGDFAIDFTVPVGTTGPVRVTVTQGDDTATDTVAVTPAPGSAPIVDITEDAVVAGQDITVAGDNWADAPLSIIYLDGDEAQIGAPVTLTPVDGSFSTAFTVPVGTPGPVRAIATQVDDVASDTVEVTAAPGPAPTADITETTVVAGQDITVTGANWADSPLSIVFADGNGTAIGTPVALTPADGVFSTTFTVPVGTTGPVRATVTQGDDSATDTVAVTAAPGPAPAVDIAETTVVAGEPVTVNGENWADAPLTIVTSDGDGAPIGSPVTLTPVGGDFTVDVMVPVGTTGPVRVTVTQGDDSATDSVAVTPAPGPAPTADITETTVVAGQDITVTGANWADSPLSIVFGDGNGAAISTPVALTPEGGVFSTTFTVPVGATGPVRATVTQGDDSATDTVVVTVAPGPALTADITETTVVAGQDITATGANWADTPLSIVFGDGNGLPIGTPVTLTPADGAFSTTFTVPVGTTGPVRATVTQGEDVATDTVAVTTAPGPASTVDIVETTVVAGQPIEVTGENWADTPLTIVVSDGNGAPIGSLITLTPTGGDFTVDVTVPVGTTGPVRVTVTQGDDTATDTVAVTPAPGPAPTADITETAVVAGQDITVTGANWTDAPLSIVFSDGNGTAIGTPVALTPADGVFSSTFTVPVGTTGPARATVTQGDDSATDTVVVTAAPGPAPNADITETTVVAGQNITVTGANWADSPLSIVFSDGNGAAIGTPVTLTPADGVFSSTFTVPVGTNGPVRATVTQGDDTATDTVAVTPAPGPAPTADITETAVVAGQDITVTGANWADAPLSIVFADGNGTAIGTPVTLTPDDGVFSSTFTVPVGTTGPVRATVTQGDDSATDTVLVTAAPGAAPTVDIVETTVVAGQPVTVVGEGWASTSPVTIVVTDGNGSPVGFPVQATPVDGEFSTSITLPAGTVGPVRVTVTQGDDSATDTVAVTPAPVEAPALDIVETTVEAGQPITTNGDGWNPGSPVSVVFTDGEAHELGPVLSATPGVDGEFSLDYTVPVGTVGPVRATATQGADAATDTVAVTAAPPGTPNAEIVEDSVYAGNPITLTGEFWDASSAVTITLTDENGDVVEVVSDVPDEDGSVFETWVVPSNLRVLVRATFVQGETVSTDKVDVLVAPSVAFEPPTAQPGDTVTVVGDGWIPATPVTVVFTDGDGNPIGEPVTVTPNDDGSFDVDWTVPPGTVGPVTVTVTQGDGTATDTLAIPALAAAATVDQPTIDRGFGAVQRVTGTGFRSGESVTATVASAGITTEPVLASSTGSVTIVIPVEFDFPVGATRAEIVGSMTGELAPLQETTDFEVIAHERAMALVEDPSIVRGTGDDQTVYGMFFEPGEVVTATVFSEPYELPTQVADASGRVSFTFQIHDEFELGSHRVELVGSRSGELPGHRENTQFVVLSTELASTGPDSMWLIGLAMLLMLAGVGTRAVRRGSAGVE